MPRHRLLLAAAALALLALGVVRAGELARHGFRPSAHGEARWFDWAWGQPQERALIPNPFYVSPEGLPAGERVFLEVEAPGARESWLHVMAQYALPDRAVVGGGSVGEDGEPPAEAVVLRLEAPERVLPPAPPRRAAKLGQLMALAGGLCLVMATGLFAAGPTSAPGWHGWLPRVPLALPLGLSLAVPLSAVAILAGLSAVAGVSVALAVSLTLTLAWSRLRGPASAPPASADDRVIRDTRGWYRLFDGLLVLFLALFVVHTAVAPIWSWDHFAIWGVKARRIAAVGLGEQTFAGGGDAFAYAQGQYPLGLPLAWLDLSLGTLPSGWLFRASHLLFGLALVWLVRQAARTLGARLPVASLAAALTAASPLLWDTESLGLAELPLALWSVAVVVLGLERTQGLDREGALARQGWPAGFLVGFLPWLKPEGWPLALLLAVALVLARRRWGGARWTARLVTAAVALAAASAVLSSRVPAEGLSFFAGDPLGRVAARLSQAGELLPVLGTELLDGAWLGGWLLFAAGMALAVWHRRGEPLLLGAVVAVQLGLYAGIYFATSLDPEQHVASSFFRISAALLPLALAAASGATDRRMTTSTFRRT